MGSLVLDFQEMEKTQAWLVGGKGLNLGKLSKIQGIQVPEGFCVTTVGYQKAIERNETLQALLDQLENATKLIKDGQRIRVHGTKRVYRNSVIA